MTQSIGLLIGDVSRLMRKRFDDRARLIGASRAQWKTLIMLSRNEGINQSGLADLLEIEPITLTRMIDRLEEAGYVERRRDPADRRAWRVHLTDAAKPMLTKLSGYADELFDTALTGLDTEARTALVASLKTIRSNLTDTDFPKEAANG